MAVLYGLLKVQLHFPEYRGWQSSTEEPKHGLYNHRGAVKRRVSREGNRSNEFFRCRRLHDVSRAFKEPVHITVSLADHLDAPG